MKPVVNRIAAAVLLLGALPAAAETMFLDGGYAELCAIAARQVEDPEAVQRYQVTGSRLGLSPLEICGRAINGYDGSGENIAESYNNRGVILFIQGNHAGALQDFERAIRQQPSMAQAHLNRGYTLNALQQWSDAVAALGQGIALGSPELAKAYYNRAIAHEESGALRAAYDDYRKAAELAPEWEAPRQELTRFSVGAR